MVLSIQAVYTFWSSNHNLFLCPAFRKKKIEKIQEIVSPKEGKEEKVA